MKGILRQDKTYGMMKLPSDWVAIVDSLNKVESEKHPAPLFSSLFANLSIQISWFPVD
ncbi:MULTISPECIES: hypothetical protein [Heyndrickxia]|uniref:hypothetical protein n=1 Tax=Heyndrickxia TaxID=2837504 RepID=UPI0030F9A90A